MRPLSLDLIGLIKQASSLNKLMYLVTWFVNRGGGEGRNYLSFRDMLTVPYKRHHLLNDLGRVYTCKNCFRNKCRVARKIMTSTFGFIARRVFARLSSQLLKKILPVHHSSTWRGSPLRHLTRFPWCALCVMLCVMWFRTNWPNYMIPCRFHVPCSSLNKLSRQLSTDPKV